MKKSKSQKGITLIVLIVTIVVLLILAAVAINSITRDGILFYAQKITEEYKISKQMEEIELEILNFNMNMLMNKILISDGGYDIQTLGVELGENEPKLGWAVVENNMITKYEFYYDEYYILNINGEVTIKKIDYTTLINVKDFGAKGDGVTDDTEAIKSAITYLNESGGTLYFPTAKYNVSLSREQDTIIALDSTKQVKIDFFASTIQLANNGYEYYNVIKINNCADAELRNGFLVGDRLEHNYNADNMPGTQTHEFGYGIFLTQRAEALIYNMDVSQMTGDAITNKNGVGGGTVTISQCNLHHCRRQGISVLDTDVINIINTYIHHIGTFDGITGTAPMTGIDLEPASGTVAINMVNIDNVKIDNTTSYGIVSAQGFRVKENYKITNSIIEGFSSHGADVSNTTLNYNDRTVVLIDSNFTDCYFNLTKNNKHTLYVTKNSFSNCIIEGENIKEEGEKSCRIWFESGNMVSNTIFKNLLGTGKFTTSSVDSGIVMPISTTVEGWSNNIYDNCSINMNNLVLKDNNSKFQNSFIVCNQSATLNNIQMKDCLTLSNDRSAILKFYNCTLENSGTFGVAIKELYNTYMSFTHIVEFYDGCICDNSTIRITGYMVKQGLDGTVFLNNSKVILDQYNDNTKLRISKSEEGTDYIVEYNGEKSL